MLGALAALWYGGVLRHVSRQWVVIGLVIAVGLGIMLSVSGGKPDNHERIAASASQLHRRLDLRIWHVMCFSPSRAELCFSADRRSARRCCPCAGAAAVRRCERVHRRAADDVRVAHAEVHRRQGRRTRAAEIRAGRPCRARSCPGATKHYFTREQFDADLKRIVAFYRDRGYPDAKVASFDVKLNDKQDAVDLTVNIDEGQPILVERLDFTGSTRCRREQLSRLKRAAAAEDRRAARSRAGAGHARERPRRAEGSRLSRTPRCG